jgi:transposase
VFCDEVSFEYGTSPTRTRCPQRPGTAQTKAVDRTKLRQTIMAQGQRCTGTKAFPPLNFFVRRGVYKRRTAKNNNGDVKLEKIANVRAEEYRDYALTPNLLWMVKNQVRVLKSPDFQWVQDNAPVHGAAAGRFLDDAGITPIPWPANSPDLNPIERIWAIMKRKLKTFHYEKLRKAGLGEIMTILQQIWKSIPNSTFEEILEELPYRIKWVLKHKGETCPNVIPESRKRKRHE